jgi:four helix bundle protein
MKDENSDLRLRTRQFALRIVRLCDTLPRSGSVQVLGHQLLRAGTSVGANFREAHRARSNAEFLAKIGDCLKELEETVYWIELLIEASKIKPARLEPLLEEASQLIAILTSIAKRIKARR